MSGGGEREAAGTIFHVQRFSLHDGPGIRDLIFLKGCPLRCAWCANPESQDPRPELSCRAARCIGCFACAAACPRGAVAPEEGGGVGVDRSACGRCFACAAACCSGALERVGEELTAAELVRRVMKRHVSWRAESGITLSGGEPLAQPEFAAQALRLFRAEGADTALETCGCVPFAALERAAPYCGLIYFDLKCMDSAVHRRYTGAGNEEILENLLQLSRRFPQVPVVARTPLIPGVNDGRDNLEATAAFLRRVPTLRDYELLPYHNWGEGKYRQLGRSYPLAGTALPDKERVRALNDALRAQIFGGA